MRYIICCAIAALLSCNAYAQFEGFRQWYPIGDDADIHYKTSYSPYEAPILFEGNPNVRYSIFNNMRSQIGKVRTKTKGKGAWAVYIAFKPQFRMYNDTSMPVRTPTYKAQIGVQKLFKLNSDVDFLSIALESGHFSNGQAGSAFNENYKDGTKQGDSMYTTINSNTNLSKLLNRTSGNYSTNITELNFNFRHYSMYTKEGTHRTDNYAKFVHSATLGFVLYHDKLLGVGNLGGYSDDDIKIYGHMRYQFGYEFTWVLVNPDKHGEDHPGNDWASPRISFSEKVELISGAHEWVNPFRSETRVSFAPGHKLSEEFQVFVGFITGHDNYNFRFVDSGTQFEAGISWSVSAPPFIGITQGKKTKRVVTEEDDEGSN